MEDIVGIILLLCLAAVGYLLYCGAKALLLCVVPVLCGLALGYYCLIGIRSVLFRAVNTSPLAYVRPTLSDGRLSFDFSRPALHGLNQLAGVLAGAFTGLLVFVVEAYTQAFEAAFEGSPTLKYVGMAVAWALPVCVWAWVRSGGGTDRWYEKIVEASLKRRGLLGSRLISALKELDGIESATEQVSDEIGIEWETKYRDAVEEYIESHPEVVADSHPADAVVRMTLQLARNDREGLCSCNDAYQRAMSEFETTCGLLTLVKNDMLLDQLQKIGTGLNDAKQLLIPNRNWQGFTSSMDDAMKAMECLSHYASQNQEEQTSERENAGHQVPPPRDSQGYYACLGLQPDASSEAIRAEYRKLAFRFHPDRNPHDTEWAKAKFQRLQEAYEVLGDEQKRKEYDLL